MKSLYLWPLRNLGRRKTRTLLTLLGVALGVAVVVGVGVLRETAIRSVSDLFDQAAGKADLTVTNAIAGIVGGEGFDAVVLEQIRAVQGVELAAPLLQVATLPDSQVDNWEYSFDFGNFRGAVLYGLEPAASLEMGHYRVVVGGELSAADDDLIWLNEHYAEELGLKVGDPLTLAGSAGTRPFTVAGLLAAEGLARINRGQVLITSLASAQRHFDRPGLMDQVDIVSAAGVETDALKAQLVAELGEKYRVFRPASKGELVDQMLQTVVLGLGFVGVLSLAVGGFLIYNTFAMTVAERTRELGLMRALGTSRGQIIRLVLVEAAFLGLLGAVLGVLLGVGLAASLRQLAEYSVTNELIGLAVLPQHLIAGLVLGVLIALLAGLVPALQAGRLPVVESIQPRRADDGRVTRSQIIAGLLLAIPGLVITLVFVIRPAELPFALIYLICVALGSGTGLLMAAIMSPAESVAVSLLGRLGVEGRLGGRNLARNPGRSALTAGALMFGLMSVIAFWGVVASLKGMADDYTNRTLAADLWIYGPHTVPSSLVPEIEALPEVELVGGGGNMPTRIILNDPAEPELAAVFTAFDLRRLARIELLFAPDGGTHQQATERLAAGQAVLIANPLREWYGYDVGDTIRLQTLEGPVDFEVAGVVLGLSAGGYSIQGSWEDAARYFGTDRPEILAVNIRPGVDPDVLGEQIVDRWGDSYGLRYESQSQFRDRVEQASNQAFALYNTLVLVGVAVAALGVVNTLVMNVLERRREIGMLRSLGMTRGQVLLLILSEAIALGLLGGILGIALGTWLSYFVVLTGAAATGYQFSYVLPTEALVICAIIALTVPVVAGMWPAWNGARAGVVEAMRSE